jgi:ribonuclease BN (tRNA processing enzyme)
LIIFDYRNTHPSASRRWVARWGEARVGRLNFLGTGDALNPERAQTSLALPLSGDETMLIDASSGTQILGRLAEAGISLESVRHLFVSHRHFDHVGGVAPLLIALTAVPEASLTIHAVSETLHALQDLLELTIPGVEGWLGKRLGWHELVFGETTEVGEAEITPFLMNHGLECTGFRVAQPDSVAVFAVDTRPSQAVIEWARGADLLVHDTFGPESTSERAHTLGHSTAAEAGEAARAAGVQRLILTHLRPSRFVDPEALVAEAETAFGGPVDAAQDLATFLY